MPACRASSRPWPHAAGDGARVRAAADQRRGRAGRTEPGVCYRLWEEAQEGAFPAYQTPEILAADLSSLLLDCAAWGVTDPASLAFLDPPPKPAVAEARALLASLGGLDSDGRITEEGKRLRALPLTPRLARMVVDAAARGEGRLAADLACSSPSAGWVARTCISATASIGSGPTAPAGPRMRGAWRPAGCAR